MNGISTKHNVNNNWLGTCRGIAAIGVILTHFLPQIDDALNLNSKIISALTVDVVDTGKIGVALLFLIAGYLTPTSKKKRTVTQFAINRIFRLYPIYWLTILLSGIFFHFDGYGIGTVAANLTMLQVFMGKEDLVGLFWTMPIELLLYAGGVVLEKYLWDYKKLLPWEILCAIGTIGIGFVRRYFWASAPVAIGLLLTIGILGQLFRLYRDDIATRRQLNVGIIIFETSLIISSILAYQVDMGHQEHWWRYVLSYSIAIAVFYFFLEMKYSIRGLTLLAVISYPVYLFQEIVFRLAFNEVWNDGMNTFLFIIGTFAILIAAATIAHIAVEKPMIKLGNNIEKKIKKAET